MTGSKRSLVTKFPTSVRVIGLLRKAFSKKKPGDLLYTTHNHEKRSLFMLIQRQSTIKKRYGDYKKQNY